VEISLGEGIMKFFDKSGLPVSELDHDIAMGKWMREQTSLRNKVVPMTFYDYVKKNYGWTRIES
jgi:hypothetical protein